jgi:hypothetical protein
MRFSRARYVTLCQQSLVTAAVLAVGLSAAGVKTLDIVPQPGATAGQPANTPQINAAGPSEVLAEGGTPVKTEVDTAPVTPKVREVAVTTTPSHPAARQSPTPSTEKKALAPAEPGPRTVESAPQKVQGYATIGVTWKHGVTYTEDQIKIQVRTLKNGTWSKWSRVQYHDDHGPDGDSSEEHSARERPGTDALVIGDVDQVQMRTTTTDGTVPPDLKLAIIDPGTGTMTKQAPAIDTAKLPSAENSATTTGTTTDDGQPQASGDSQDTVSLSAMKTSPKPYIYSRAQWGANEKMREQSAPSYGTVKTGFVHHTVNANNYTAAQVPALLRGIYAYHTQSRGWRDIGYNYLVDRFGRIWEGRWGGVDRAVVGAHTLGYNEVSFAMSAIGNYDIAQPPQAVLDAYARLFAWKLSLYNIPANQTSILVKGRRLNAINGHRDVGQTACPGRYLYAKIPWIRAKARQLQIAAQSGGGGTPTPTPPPTPKPPVFTSPTQTARPAASQPSSIRFPRSLNLAGASYPDVVLKDYAGNVKLLATGGQVGYRTVGSSPGAWRSMTLLAAVNDVTGDGKGDVLGRIGGGVTRIYRGDGAGHVSRTGIAATTTFKHANKVIAAGDFNGDRRNDVLMRQWSNGGLYLVPGRGAGTFGKPRLLGMGWSGYSSIAVPGDVTGDGRPDVVGVKKGVLYVFPNVGGSRIRSAVSRQTVGSAYNAVVGSGRDISGDGVGDLLVRSRSNGQLGIRTGRTHSTMGDTMGMFSGAVRWTRVSAGQMTGSPQADFVGVGPLGSKLLVMSNNGLRNVSDLASTNLKLPNASMVINAGDWNRDGKGDIIARDSNKDRLVLYPGRGSGQYGAGVVMSTGWKTFVNLAAVGDVTGDGKPDLMGRVEGGKMTIFPGAGGAKFQAPILAPSSMRTFNQIGSGAWSTAAMPNTSVFSIGAFFVPSVARRGKIPSPYNRVVGPGDVNGDGRADLVVRDTAGTLWLLPGTASGYGARRYLAAGFKSYETLG